MTSPFLAVPPSDWIASNALAFAIRDRYPVTPGHTLVITRRLVATWFDATPDERAAILELVDEVKHELDASPNPPDGFNVGFNAGEAAGQTIPHLHLHVIPRYRGDMPDPRGGVRHVIPWRGNYLRPPPPALATGAVPDPFLRHLLPLFARATSIAIVAAFVQESGLLVLRDPLFGALARGARVQILTGDYLEITQVDALDLLLGWASLAPWTPEGAARPAGGLETRIMEVAKLAGTTRSFHPKSWRLEGPDFAVAFVGSSNVSRGALGDGIEWNLRADRERDPLAHEQIVRAFDELWSKATPLTSAWIAEYALRARTTPAPPPPGEVEPDLPEPPPEPNDIHRRRPSPRSRGAARRVAGARSSSSRRALRASTSTSSWRSLS